MFLKKIPDFLSKYYLSIAIVLSLALGELFVGPYAPDYHISSWRLFLMIFALAGFVWIKEILHWIVALNWLWTAALGIYYIEHRNFYWANEEFMLTMFAAFLLTLATDKKAFWLGLEISILIGSIDLIFEWHHIFTKTHHVGSTLLICSLPILIKTKSPSNNLLKTSYQIIRLWLPILGALAAGGTVAFGLLGFFALYLLITNRKLMTWAALSLVGAAFLFLAHAKEFHIFETNGRIAKWKWAWDCYFHGFYYYKDAQNYANINPATNMFTGYGPGSWREVMYHIQKSLEPGLEQGFFVWAHNDWLELFFQTGIIGLCLGLWMWGLMIYRCEKWVRLSVILFGLSMIFQPMMHIIACLLFAIYLLKEAFEGAADT